MAHPSLPSRFVARLTVGASCLCLVAFACGNTTENDSDGETAGCPSLEPAPGSGCPIDNRVCAYDNCTAPEYRDYHDLHCIDGAWVLAFAEACQVGVCPDDPPPLRSYCDVSVTPGPCAALDACGELREGVCTHGIWEAALDADAELPGTTGGSGTGGGAPVAPTCPLAPPSGYSPCCPAWVPEQCDYTESATDGAAGASFIIAPPSSTGGDAEPSYPLQCAVCTTDMLWLPCPVKIP